MNGSNARVACAFNRQTAACSGRVSFDNSANLNAIDLQFWLTSELENGGVPKENVNKQHWRLSIRGCDRNFGIVNGKCEVCDITQFNFLANNQTNFDLDAKAQRCHNCPNAGTMRCEAIANLGNVVVAEKEYFVLLDEPGNCLQFVC